MVVGCAYGCLWPPNRLWCCQGTALPGGHKSARRQAFHSAQNTEKHTAAAFLRYKNQKQPAQQSARYSATHTCSHLRTWRAHGGHTPNAVQPSRRVVIYTTNASKQTRPPIKKSTGQHDCNKGCTPMVAVAACPCRTPPCIHHKDRGPHPKAHTSHLALQTLNLEAWQYQRQHATAMPTHGCVHTSSPMQPLHINAVPSQPCTAEASPCHQ
jgi:hypothetical protein